VPRVDERRSQIAKRSDREGGKRRAGREGGANENKQGIKKEEKKKKKKEGHGS